MRQKSDELQWIQINTTDKEDKMKIDKIKSHLLVILVKTFATPALFLEQGYANENF